MTTVIRCADADEAAEQAAAALTQAITSARAARGAAHVALSGGSDVPSVLQRLGAAVKDWRDVHLWYGDERVVPHDSPDSTHRLAQEHLDAPGATWHPVDTDLAPEQAAAAYATQLDGTILDVALNGMGADGHTASLFPGYPQLHTTGIAVAVQNAPKPPPQRISLTLAKLNESRRIVLLVTGHAKATMLARVIAGLDPAVPASLLARDRLTIIADAAALDA